MDTGVRARSRTLAPTAPPTSVTELDEGVNPALPAGILVPGRLPAPGAGAARSLGPAAALVAVLVLALDQGREAGLRGDLLRAEALA
eukprot:2520023-Alexandrium_andersonii.AAC.1